MNQNPRQGKPCQPMSPPFKTTKWYHHHYHACCKNLHSIVVFDMLNYCLRFKNQHISSLLGNSAMNSPLSRPTVHITGFYTLTPTPLHIQDFFPWGGILKKKQQLLRRQLLIAWKIETSLLLRASLLNAQLWCVERNTIHRLRCCY